MAGNEVKTKHIHASASLLSGRGRLMGLVVNHKTGVSGNIIVYDNTAASGSVLIEVDESVAGTFDVVFPGDGILYETGVYAALPANTSLTIFYQQG